MVEFELDLEGNWELLLILEQGRGIKQAVPKEDQFVLSA